MNSPFVRAMFTHPVLRCNGKVLQRFVAYETNRALNRRKARLKRGAWTWHMFCNFARRLSTAYKNLQLLSKLRPFTHMRQHPLHLSLRVRNTRLTLSSQNLNRRRNRHRHLIHARGLNVILESIDLHAQLARLSVHHPAHAVRGAQRLVLLKPMPRVNRNAIIPPSPELWQVRILGWELNSRDLLKGVFDGVPLDSDIVHGLLIQVLEHLGAESVGDFVVEVEVSGFGREDVDWIVVFDEGFFLLDLLVAEGEDAVFGHVVAVAVGGLGVLWHSVHFSSRC